MKSKIVDFLIGTNLPANKLLNVAWLFFRVHIGLSIAIFAGWPKMNEGMAPDWFVEQVGGLGFTFPSPQFWAALAAWGEFTGGLMIAFGFLTRFAAMQLAFQFFVIAFLWYDEPIPFIGMYFQHLYFWCYGLVAVAGGGHYSIDQLLRNGFRRIIRIPIGTTLTTIVVLILTLNARGQSVAPAVSISDFDSLTGNYTGKLTYLDYSSNQWTSIEASVKIEKKGKQIAFIYDYPNEPGHGRRERLKISAQGTKLNGEVILSKQQENGELILVTSASSIDNSQQAAIRHTYILGDSIVQIKKEVKYANTEEYFIRNTYQLEKR